MVFGLALLLNELGDDGVDLVIRDVAALDTLGLTPNSGLTEEHAP